MCSQHLQRTSSTGIVAVRPGFGVKITPKGRKVFIVLYRAAGAGSRLRKYTIGPYGRVTLHQARAAALKIFAARTEGRDPAAEKQQARYRLVVDVSRIWSSSSSRSMFQRSAPHAKSRAFCAVRLSRAGEGAAFTTLASAKSLSWSPKSQLGGLLPPPTNCSK